MPYLFTSESVSEGHPDKVADQISDTLLDHFLAFDENSRTALETLVTTGQVILAGEVKSSCYLDMHQISRDVINRIGYTKSEYMFEGNSCGILSAIHEQSGDIARGLDKTDPEEQGAGDQGMMFGYACNETENYLPLPLALSHKILRELATVRKEGKEMTYLRPDSKSQVTIEYGDDNRPKGIHTIVVSTQHDDFDFDKDMHATITNDIRQIIIPRVMDRVKPEVRALFNGNIKYLVNPTGKFVIGGPHGDAGVTGRKIIVDTYGGKGGHGGGAFSGKDPSKVDRSAAYAMRHIAKNLVAAGVCNEVTVQVAYAIGIARPMSLYINTYGSSKVDKSDYEIAEMILRVYDLRPYSILKRLKLKQPIYAETAAYGHFGRTPRVVTKFFRDGSGNEVSLNVELFTWEKLDMVEELKEAFGIK
jgi:S-adenosylmethionine synthetase